MTYKVTLKPSGHEFDVAEGQTILSAGLASYHVMPYSCRTGVCCTCRGTVLEGKVDFGMVHPTYLSEADKANGLALLCQAKPLSDVVIEAEELEGLAGIETRQVPCRIAAIDKPSADIAKIKLRLPPMKICASSPANTSTCC